MLSQRILSTLRFFDLQDLPLSLLELEKYLLVEMANVPEPDNHQPSLDSITSDQILRSLQYELVGKVETSQGFYFLSGRKNIVKHRQENYLYGIERERRITRFATGLRHIPFIRGAALTGSQALGLQKNTSDIDLFIITDPKFLWLSRTLVTAYFHILGMRRFGKKIVNRFCLNHYISGPKEITKLKNLYTASEYIKIRPLVYEQGIREFQRKNEAWLKGFFPNWQIPPFQEQKQSGAQKIIEKLFSGRFGLWLESKLKNWQLPKIRQEEFIIVEEDELSFHPQSKQQSLLDQFFNPL
jgi:hypothetical protein